MSAVSFRKPPAAVHDNKNEEIYLGLTKAKMLLVALVALMCCDWQSVV